MWPYRDVFCLMNVCCAMLSSSSGSDWQIPDWDLSDVWVDIERVRHRNASDEFAKIEASLNLVCICEMLDGIFYFSVNDFNLIR